MLKIWGRNTSINVQKTLWAIGELSVPHERIALFSFALANRTASDVMSRLDACGIAVRAGDLASLPLLKQFGLRSAVRASCYLYTSHDDVDALADALSDPI